MLVALLPFIQSVLRSRGVPARDTPDLAQDLVIELLPKVACFAPGELQAPYDRCRRYLHVVATRYAWGYLRRAARRGEHLNGEPDWPEPEGGEGPAPVPSPEALLLQHESAARLTAELDLHWLSRATSPACWRAFHAYHVTGTPIAEIAAAEVAPTATVYNRIRIARRDLRAAILRRRAADHRQ